MKNQKKFNAFSLIELIFAILIIALISSSFAIILQISPKIAKFELLNSIISKEVEVIKSIFAYDFDDIDDFDNQVIDGIEINVSYVEEVDYNKTILTLDLSKKATNSNIKLVKATAYFENKKIVFYMPFFNFKKKEYVSK